MKRLRPSVKHHARMDGKCLTEEGSIDRQRYQTCVCRQMRVTGVRFIPMMPIMPSIVDNANVTARSDRIADDDRRREWRFVRRGRQMMPRFGKRAIVRS